MDVQLSVIAALQRSLVKTHILSEKHEAASFCVRHSSEPEPEPLPV